MEIDATEIKRIEKETKEIEAEEKKKIQKIKELKCSWCKKWIVDDAIEGEPTHYYQCCYHGNIFCDNCAHDNYQKEVPAGKFVMCKENQSAGKKTDCIFNKKYIEVEEVKDETGEKRLGK